MSDCIVCQTEFNDKDNTICPKCRKKFYKINICFTCDNHFRDKKNPHSDICWTCRKTKVNKPII